MPRGLLKPDQLCDVLNYVLERPRRGTMNYLISPVVVKAWIGKSDRLHVENWCDRQLVLAGMMPEIKRSGGRIPGLAVPRVIRQFVIEDGAHWRPR